VIELSSDHLTVIDTRTDPVTITGRGRLVGRYNAPFNLTTVRVTDGSEVAADGLTILQYLQLEGSASLMGVSGDWVRIENGAELVLSARGRKIPRLNLGSVGAEYDAKPKLLRVEIEESSFESEELGALHESVISGRTIDNCEFWMELARVFPESERFAFDCQPRKNEKIEYGSMRELLLIGKPEWVKPPETEWVVIFVGTAAPTLVGIVVILLCVCRRHSGSDGIPLDAPNYTESQEIP
jgi:hypothetical protein